MKQTNPSNETNSYYFDELKKIGARLPNTKTLPCLFDFQKKEFEFSKRSIIKAIPDKFLGSLCKIHLNNWNLGIRIC